MDSRFPRLLRTPATLGLMGVVCGIGPMLTGEFTGESTATATTPDPNSIPFIKLRSDVWEIVIRRAGPGRAEVERVWAQCNGEWVNACYPDLDAASRQRALTSTFRASVQLQGDFTYCSGVAIDLPHDMARQLVRPSTADLCLALKGPGQATVYKGGDPGTVATTQARRGSQALPASRDTRVYKGGEMPASPQPAQARVQPTSSAPTATRPAGSPAGTPRPAPIALDDGLEGVYSPPTPVATAAPTSDPELDALLGDVPQYQTEGAVRRPAQPGSAPPQGRVQPASTGSTAARPAGSPAGTPRPEPIALDDGLQGVYTPPAPAPTAAPTSDPELDALLGDVPQYQTEGAVRRPAQTGSAPPQGRVQPATAGSTAARRAGSPAGTPHPEPIALDDGLEGVYTPPSPQPRAPDPDPDLDALLGDVPQYTSQGAVRGPAPVPTRDGTQASAARPSTPQPEPLALDDGQRGIYTPPTPKPTAPPPTAPPRTAASTPAPASPAPAAPAPAPSKRGRKNKKNRGPTELELEDQELQNLAPIRRRDADEDEEPIGVVGPRGRYLIIDIEGLPEDDTVPERTDDEWGFDPDAEPTDDGLDL